MHSIDADSHHEALVADSYCTAAASEGSSEVLVLQSSHFLGVGDAGGHTGNSLHTPELQAESNKPKEAPLLKGGETSGPVHHDCNI